eukprot:gnl/TRDRNA2_/TRDRNA2_84017_c0_seq2.p1 gnl/TRDRNA2_/TRDRNA2_84017_c0~~gnl/TRDRNA2_/TRDRNA2_84017_c0_seq2.p1  ORF type:complete len:317 (-),score=12.10 gnl/TRDRNA2_/TRDRNA2_84017_c0_seq2:113-1063(-)
MLSELKMTRVLMSLFISGSLTLELANALRMEQPQTLRAAHNSTNSSSHNASHMPAIDFAHLRYNTSMRYNTSVTGIPKIIMQTNQNAANRQRLKQMWQPLNPSYTYFFYDDRDIRDFLRSKDMRYLKAFDDIIPGAIKKDFFQLVWLYEYGGAFIDVDNHPGRLDRYAGLGDIIIAKSMTPNSPSDSCQGHLYNAVMLARPRTQFVKRALDTALQRINSRWHIQDARGNNGLKTCYGLAGPTLLGETLCNSLRNKASCTYVGGSVSGTGCMVHTNQKRTLDSGEVIYILEEGEDQVTTRMKETNYPGDCGQGHIFH